MNAKEYWQLVSPLFLQIQGVTHLYLRDFAMRRGDMMELLDVIEKIRVATKDIAGPIIKFSESPNRIH